MDLRYQTDSVANVQKGLHCDVLDVGANETTILNMIMQVFIHVLRRIAIMNQTVTELVQGFECGNLHTVELTVSEQCVDGLLGKARVLLEEIVIENLSQEVPRHDPKTCISILCEPHKPS